MVENDPIDELLKNRMHGQHFSPEPGDWQDMEKLLDEHMPVKKRRWLWGWLLLLCLTASGTWMLMNSAEENVSGGTEKIQPQHAEANADHHANDQLNEVAEMPMQNETIASENKRENNTGQAQALTKESPARSEKPDSYRTDSYRPDKDQPPHKKKSSSGKPLLPAGGKARNNEVKKSDSHEPLVGKTSEAEREEKTFNNPSVSPKETKEKEETLAGKEPGKGDDESGKKTDTLSIMKTDTAIAAIPGDSLVKEEAAVGDTVVNAIPDSAVKTPSQSDDKRFHISAGILAQTGVMKTAYGGGVGVAFDFSKRLTIGAGAYYTVYTGLNDVKNHTSGTYSFGFTEYEHSIYTKRLYYLHLPLEVHFRLGERHLIGTALHTDLLLNSDNVIEISSHEFPGEYFMEAGKSFSSRKAKGYNIGYRENSFSLALTYGYKPMRNLLLMVKAQYGLTDNTDNEYFEKYIIQEEVYENKDMRRNTAIQFIVRYQLISW